jgi:hypothetical protein
VPEARDILSSLEETARTGFWFVVGWHVLLAITVVLAVVTRHQVTRRDTACMRGLRLATFLIASIAVAAPTTTRADAPAHVLEARLGVGSLSVREDLLVPYAFTGPDVRTLAGYTLRTGPDALAVALDFGLAPVFTRASDFGVVVHHGLEAGYLRRALTRPAHQLEVGPLLRFNHELALLDSWDDAHGYWLDVLMLGFALRHATPLWAKGTLESQGSLLLLGLASRPPPRRLNKQDALTHADYHVNRLGQSPDFAWPGKPLVAHIEGVVRLRRSAQPSGTGFGIGAETRFSHAPQPEPYTSWYGGIITSYGWSAP